MMKMMRREEGAGWDGMGGEICQSRHMLWVIINTNTHTHTNTHITAITLPILSFKRLAGLKLEASTNLSHIDR